MNSSNVNFFSISTRVVPEPDEEVPPPLEEVPPLPPLLVPRDARRERAFEDFAFEEEVLDDDDDDTAWEVWRVSACRELMDGVEEPLARDEGDELESSILPASRTADASRAFFCYTHNNAQTTERYISHL